MKLTRRGFVAGAAAVAAASWVPAGRSARAAGEGPAGFPDDIGLYRQRYQNWSKEIVLDDLWTCRPGSSADVVAIARWAAGAGWQVRARGAMHGWSPILVTPDTTPDSRVVLVDTTGLTAIDVDPVARTARCGAGVRLLDLLTALEAGGLGLKSVPAVGDVTVGGMLAIGAHGAAVPGPGEARSAGTFGSLSDAVRQLTAVVWERSSRRYVARTFIRGEPELRALACSLGRTFVTEVVLDVAPLDHLRCRSSVDVPGAELFAPPGSGGRTFASYLDATGRAEVLWYPFTENPWLKVWEVAPTQPLGSRRTTGPYNYPFSDQIPEALADLARELVSGNPGATPAFGQMTYAVTAAGLTATASHDLWGPAKDTQLYIRSSTLRVRELGLAVLTARAHVQEVAHLLATRWTDLIDEFAASGRYPVNMPFELRASGLDGRAAGPSPTLTATSPDPSRPDFDTVLFTNPLTLTGTPDSDAFFAEYERFVRTSLDPAKARLRPEWSKNFAHTDAGPVTDPGALEDIRDAFRSGRRRPDAWDGAAATFDALDPHRLFSNGFLAELFS